ncbi:hypothetical protein FORC74_p080 (plasmid) [Salmonella enterica]|nr:hypothetical protein FORC74_p080 [Salmonella enterica]
MQIRRYIREPAYTVVNRSSGVSRDTDFPKKTCANCSVVSLTGRASDAGLRPVDSVSGQMRDRVMRWCSPCQYAVARPSRRTPFPRGSVSRFPRRPATSVPPQNPHDRVGYPAFTGGFQHKPVRNDRRGRTRQSGGAAPETPHTAALT